MRKISILLVLLLTVLVPIASADIVNTLDIKVNDYNENTEYVPSYLKAFLGDEIFKLTIVDNDDEKRTIEVITEDAYITSLKEVEEDTEFDATMIVVASEETVEAVIDSDKPLKAFIDARDNGEIIIEPVGIMNSITYTVANGVIKVSQLFELV
ncbi:hypothetical protein HNV12_07475 [Methanococcoides sp. SA1]|nr:hypothetical protein [Methanococcoides sp. SA1]